MAPAQLAPVMCSGTDWKRQDCPFKGEGIEMPSWGGSRRLCRLTLARTGGGVGATPLLRFFADSKKRRRYAPPGFGLPYGANLAQFLANKI